MSEVFSFVDFDDAGECVEDEGFSAVSDGEGVVFVVVGDFGAADGVEGLSGGGCVGVVRCVRRRRVCVIVCRGRLHRRGRRRWVHCRRCGSGVAIVRWVCRG